GYSNITLTLSKGGNTKTLVINYAASSSSATATTYWHTGTSDASAAIALDDDYMVIGDDEHNLLYVYGRHQPGLPVTTYDFNQGNLLGLTDGTPGAFKELDIEMGTRSIVNPTTMYWMGSMSNSSSFNNKPNRDRIIAVTASGTGAATSFTDAGHYAGLRAQLLTWGDANGYNFTASAAEGIDPKTISGFNLEGMVFAPDNTTMYLGFRAPLVPTANRTNAVIAPIQNFEAWFNSVNNGSPSAPATIGAPIELNLGGRGIRDLIRLSNGNYIILAGSYDGTSNPAIYSWNGLASNPPTQVSSFDLSGLNPEGAMEMHEGGLLSLDKLQIISDDGDQLYYGDGVEAKDLPDDNFKKFNSAIVLSSAANALPIQFESFTAVRQNTSILLNWKTGDPGTIDLFDVQRSVNGLDFTTIGSVSATAGQTAYSFTDNQPGAATKMYYRINAREITGNSYLSTIRVIGAGASETVKLYPNPASNGVVSVIVTAPGEKQLVIYNSKGQLQAQYAFSEQAKDISTAGWPAGYYLVRVAVGGVLVSTTALVVQ
ncbi:MAG TPA: T9SS type A sorting domain-containing protein, partial [Chitinophagaceae bacterium]